MRRHLEHAVEGQFLVNQVETAVVSAKQQQRSHNFLDGRKENGGWVPWPVLPQYQA